MICETPNGRRCEEKAVDYLVHYFRVAGVDTSGDAQAEIRIIVKEIIAAVLAELEPKLAELKSQKQGA